MKTANSDSDILHFHYKVLQIPMLETSLSIIINQCKVRVITVFKIVKIQGFILFNIVFLSIVLNY